MDRLSQMRMFAEVVERGGFAAAADALGTTRSAASKQVMALENTLGVRLLNRTTRKVSLTEVGWAYYERVVTLLSDIEETERAITDLHQQPKGILRVNAPMSFGTLHLGKAIADFLTLHADLNVQLTLNDRFIDPLEEGADITIRIGTLESSSFIARRIAPIRLSLVASPAYLAKAGRPESAADLADHACLYYGHVAQEYRWTLEAQGRSESVALKVRLCANNGEVLCDAARRGLGITALPTFIVGPHLRSGALEIALPGWRPADVAMHALYTPNRHLAAKVRMFIDFLVARFGDDPSWDHPA